MGTAERVKPRNLNSTGGEDNGGRDARIVLYQLAPKTIVLRQPQASLPDHGRRGLAAAAAHPFTVTVRT
eukprot:464124-Rhodomonas_salina.2